jgi:hypothetical protein
MTWADRYPRIYERELDFVHSNYCDLHFKEVAGTIMILGSFEFQAVYGQRQINDIFQLKIVFPHDYPDNVPATYETAHRIRNFHINPDMTLCLGSPLELHAIYFENPCLETYINKILIPYFVRYVHFEKTGHVLYGELEHGRKGLLRYIRDLTGTRDDVLAKYLLELYLMGTADTSFECPCGSRLVFSDCHKKRLQSLQYVPKYLIRKHLGEAFR